MRGATVLEVRGVSDRQVQEMLDIVGVEIGFAKAAARPGWVAYTLRSTTKKRKIIPVPGYIFIGMNYAQGKAKATSKWKTLHPQTFPGEVFKPVLNTYDLTTEDWYDLVHKLFEAGAAGVKVHKKQFNSLALFERYCDEQGVWRIIQAERGLNK